MLFRSLAFIARLAGRLVLLFVLLFLAVRGLELFADAHRFPVSAWLMQTAGHIEQPVLELIRRNVPTHVKGLDISYWILLAGLLLLWGLIDRVEYELKSRANYQDWQAQPIAALTTPGPSQPVQPSDALPAFDPNLERERLLEVYTQSKKSLDQKKRRLAFLALDVVGSTEMKRGEDPGIVERDFRKYRHLVEQIIDANKALKSAWTPDGAMICFASAQEAVLSAQALILQLEDFNRDTKTIRADFTVRAGIHTGEILFDDSVQLERISDMVIDVAGHMQKHASPNSLCLARETLDQLSDRQGFQPVNRDVDGCAAYEWRKSDREDPASQA